MHYCDQCQKRRARHVLNHASAPAGGQSGLFATLPESRGSYSTYLCEECFRAAHPHQEATMPGTFAAAGCWIWLALLCLSGLLFYVWLR